MPAMWGRECYLVSKYMEDPLEHILERYINQTVVHPEFGVYFIKELVIRIRKMKIEINPNDHNPPHFHVKSHDKSIDAVFRLDNCSFIQGRIGGDDLRRIEEFYKDPRAQELMKVMWNKSKVGNNKLN